MILARQRLVLILWLTCGFAGCTDTTVTESPVVALERAIGQLQAGDVDGGLDLARRTLEDSGKDPRIAARPDVAVALWTGLRGVDPVSLPSGLLLNAALLASAAGQAERVRDDLLELADQEPPAFAPRFVVGDMSARAGAKLEAMRWFAAAVEVAPERYEGHLQLAMMLADGNLLPEAVDEFDATLRLRPEEVKARYYRGIVFEKMQRYDEALADFREVANGDSDDAHRAMNNVGALLVKLGDHDQACRQFERVLEIDPRHVQALYNLASVSYEMGRFDEALTYFERYAAVRPEDPRAHALVGRIQEESGQPELAEAEYRAALAMNPALTDARHRLVQLLRRTGRGDEADALESVGE